LRIDVTNLYKWSLDASQDIDLRIMERSSLDQYVLIYGYTNLLFIASFICYSLRVDRVQAITPSTERFVMFSAGVLKH